MFKNRAFYHQHIRKTIIAFGTLFNGIYVNRQNDAGEFVQQLKVPLSYGPKQKFITRIGAIDDLEAGRTAFEVVLPRIGFEITGLTYHGSRKLPVMQRVRSIDVGGGVREGFVSTPYNMSVALSVFAKNQDDGLQIVEQIFPHFSPDFNVTVNEIPELGVSRDLQFILDSVSYTNDFEGSFDNRLKVIWDLNFTIKINFFGFVDDAALIRKTIINLYNDPSLVDGNHGTNLDGVRITTTVDPIDADPTSDYSYVQEFDELFSI